MIARQAGSSSRTWPMFISRPSRILSSWISEMGAFFASEKVRCRRRTGVLNVIVSMSSEPAAKTWRRASLKKWSATRAQRTLAVALHTLPPRASSAACASASPGAYSRKGGGQSVNDDEGKVTIERGRTMMTGMPISRRSRWHSAFCSLVTRTWRRLMRSTSSAVPGARESADRAGSRRRAEEAATDQSPSPLPRPPWPSHGPRSAS